MGELDDKFNERAESLENEFFEEFKKGKERNKIINQYHEKLEKLISSFEKDYKWNLSRERKIIGKKKPNKKKIENYSQFEVKHLDFNQSGSDKFKMKWRLFSFRLGRTYRKTLLKMVPSHVVYWNYKLKIFFVRFFGTLKDIVIRIVETIAYLIKRIFFLVFYGIRDSFKYLFAFLKKIFQKIAEKLKRKKKEEVKKDVEEEPKTQQESED